MCPFIELMKQGMSSVAPESSENTTREKILSCAAELFSEKGFTETSVRELATAVGVKGSSIYNHFSSKNAILQQMLEDYSSFNIDVFSKKDINKILQENPTSDGILSCLQLYFPPERQNYYLKVLCVLLQEQLRNPIVRKYMAEQFILRSEQNVGKVIDVLKKLGIIHQDADPDYWMKASASLFYSFATRRMLDIGDDRSDFTGRGMGEMLRETFDIMLERCGTKKA